MRKRTWISMILMGAAAVSGFASGAGEAAAGPGKGIMNTGSEYPIVNQPTTLSIATGTYPDGTPPEEKWFWKYMQAKTGIQMKIQQLTPQNMKEQVNLMFATGQLPDILLHVGLTNAEVSRYGGQGYFKPLGPLVDQHAPNIKKAFLETPSAKAAVTSPDGNIYMLPGIYQDKESFATQRPLINRLWLKNLGMEPPKTLDDFYKMLVAFKTQDANKNGNPNDEVPFGGAWNEGYDERLPVLTALGFVTNGSRLAYRNGKPTFMPYDPLYEEFLKIMNRYWKEGLLDPDLFTQTGAQARAKYSNGSVGVILEGAGFVFAENHWLEYDAFTPLTSAFNQTRVWPAFTPIVLSTFFLSQNCQYPEAAVRWANWFFTEENSVLFWGGPLVGSEEAKMGGMTEFGRYFDQTNRIQFKLPPGIDSSWQYVYRKASPVFGFSLGFVYGKGANEKSWFFEKKMGKQALPVAPASISVYQAEEPRLGIFASLSKENETRFKAMYERTNTEYKLRGGVAASEQQWAYKVLQDAGWIVDGVFLGKDIFWRSRFLANVTPNFSAFYPAVFFTPVEVERLSELTTPLEDYIAQMEARFITGVEPLSSFPRYRQELEKLGVKEYQQIHIAAEERYVKSMGK